MGGKKGAMKTKSIMFKVLLITHAQEGIKVRRRAYRFLAVLLFTAVMPYSLAYAAPSVNEDFSGTLSPHLEDSDSAYTIAGGKIHKTTFISNDGRSYIRTVATDYNTVDFIAELTFTLTALPGGDFAIHFFGLGPGSPDPTFFNESGGVLFRIHSSDIVGGRVDVASRAPGAGGSFGLLQSIGNITTSGHTHRARITKTGNQVEFAIDLDFNGTFEADISQSVNLAVVAPFLNNTNSRIYFGTASAVDVFDDLEISVIMEVLIDIKPGSFPNSISLGSAGLIPVAILSSPTFDATEVNPSSVTLAGAKVKLIGKGDKYSCNAEDVNGDNLLDLVCHVMTAQFLIESGDSVAVLEAETFSGQAIRGQDSIQIVP